MRVMAIDHGRDGVCVNAVGPGFTKTAETIGAFLDRIPLGRLGEPEDVARVVLFPASDAAGFVTGVTCRSTAASVHRTGSRCSRPGRQGERQWTSASLRPHEMIAAPRSALRHARQRPQGSGTPTFAHDVQ